MRAKLLFYAEKPRYQAVLRLAQQALSEVAIAFSHSFTLRDLQQGQPGAGLELQNFPMAQGAALLAGSADFVADAARQGGCFAGLREPALPGASEPLSRLKQGSLPMLRLLWPLQDSQAALGKTAVAACAAAGSEGGRLLIIRGGGSDHWPGIVAQAARYAAIPAPEALTPAEFLDLMLVGGLQQATVLATPEAAALIKRLDDYLQGSEALGFTAFLADTHRFQAVTPPGGQADPAFFSCLFAAADALGHSLGLTQEADCLRTALYNVLASGWRTMEFSLAEKTISHEEALRLVAEQVQLAGELFERIKPRGEG